MLLLSNPLPVNGADCEDQVVKGCYLDLINLVVKQKFTSNIFLLYCMVPYLF